MNPTGPNPYLRTKIMTASPEELRLMLYDGAIRFCRQALQAMSEKNHDQWFDAMMRSQKIVLELSTSLNHEVAPEMCGKLSALYNYIYRRLVDATVQRQVEPIQEALQLLEFERETWQMLMQKLTQERIAQSMGDPSAMQNAQQTAISSLPRNKAG